MFLKRLSSRARFISAVCGAVALLTLNGLAQSAPATGPAIQSTTIVPSSSWDPKAAIDRDGNIYVTGGAQTDAGTHNTVTKLDPTGQTVLYAVELPLGWSSPIVIGADGNAWVGAGPTLFKLDPNGNILLQRAFGNMFIDLALGPNGDIYSVATSQPGCRIDSDPECFGADVIVSKIDPNTGFETQEGSLAGSRDESAHAIAVGPDGRIFVTGYTYSPDLPVSASALMKDINSDNNPNAFFAAFDSQLRLAYATYFHGTFDGEGFGVAAGSDGSAYVMFEADQSPLLPPGGGMVYAKFDAAFHIVAMRRMAGWAQDIALDSTGHLLSVGDGGNLDSGSIPVAHVVGVHPVPNADTAFVAKFNADLSGLDALYYLASPSAAAGSVAVGADDRAVVAGYANEGAVLASQVQLINPPSWPSQNPVFVSKLDLSIATGNTMPGPNVGVAASDPATSVTFANVSGPGTTTLQAVDPNALNLSLPGGFGISNSAIAYEIHTTATVSAPITVCLNASSLNAADRAAATILHGIGGQWVAEPTTDVGNGQLCANVGSLSPFAVGVRVDSAAPLIACQQADGAWHPQNVALSCTASDAGVGLANAADASFTLATTVASGSEQGGAVTGTRQVCDRSGNCAVAGPIAGNMIDMKAPVVSIASPTSRAYLLNESATAQYACADGGSGATCTGTVANGAALNTASVGSKTFTVSAKDGAGNASSASTAYSVGYGVKVLFDRYIAYKRGSVVPIVLQLADGPGANVSAASIALSNVTINGKAATSAQQLKYVPLLRSYNVNLNTTGFAAGTYTLAFKAGADSAAHSVQFIVK